MKKDLHVHLYGCLSAEDLWFIGENSYRKRKPFLKWYADEYSKAWERTITPEHYWEKENGLERLKQDYIFDKPASFQCFQANFNLIIALCPLSGDDFSIPKLILHKASSQGLEYFEPRTLIPFRFTREEAFAYIKGLCLLFKEFNQSSSMQSKIVFSLFRENDLAEKHYNWLRDFIREEPILAEEISGIDFAFAEEGSPPLTKKALFKKFYIDNAKEKKLDLLYHVGESFGDKSQTSAIRWVYEAWKLGCTRLGHAIALGVDPENFRNQVVTESKEEFFRTQQWLLENFDFFKSYGLELRKDTIERRLKCQEDQKFLYDDSSIAEIKDVQKAVALALKEDGVLIECCPKSNELIGQVRKSEFHPQKFFDRHGLNYVLGTDDPGLFNLW